ncbi:hypothetical protein BJF90_31780 [Pseudonocardia sp. CNS-004]|nr:hypothetical protein BJF90_31780 [Pseudonocardia sp. CNS-004]
MTTPGGGGGPSPMRLGGLGLIGVAVVAAVIGLASTATNGDPQPTAIPSADASSVTAQPEAAPPPPGEPVPTDAAGLPVPSFTQPVPGEPAPGAVPPGEAAPGAVPPALAAPGPVVHAAGAGRARTGCRSAW